jgi:hypothetical protein
LALDSKKRKISVEKNIFFILESGGGGIDHFVFVSSCGLECRAY